MSKKELTRLAVMQRLKTKRVKLLEAACDTFWQDGRMRNAMLVERMSAELFDQSFPTAHVHALACVGCQSMQNWVAP